MSQVIFLAPHWAEATISPSEALPPCQTFPNGISAGEGCDEAIAVSSKIHFRKRRQAGLLVVALASFERKVCHALVSLEMPVSHIRHLWSLAQAIIIASLPRIINADTGHKCVTIQTHAWCGIYQEVGKLPTSGATARVKLNVMCQFQRS